MIYSLLQDLPALKKGSIFKSTNDGKKYYSSVSDDDFISDLYQSYTLDAKTVEENPEWFKKMAASHVFEAKKSFYKEFISSQTEENYKIFDVLVKYFNDDIPNLIVLCDEDIILPEEYLGFKIVKFIEKNHENNSRRFN